MTDQIFNWTRRGVLAAGVAMSLVFGAVAPAQAQTPPGVLVVGQIAEPKALDPAAVTAVNDFRILMNVYDGLVRYKSGTLEVEPSLATAWEISEDGTEYTFTLREGVTFHDGSAFDAEAVKFNFDRMLKEDHPYHDTGPFPLAFFFSAVEEVSVVDPMTVSFKLNAPYAPFLSNLAYPTGLIVSPEAVKQYGKDFGRNPTGTGAYKFAEWEANAKVVAVKNEDYWDGAPELEALIYRPITDANTRIAEMLSGGLDVMVEVPPDSLQQFKDDSTFKVLEQAGPHVWFLILNTREAPFDVKAARQAANYAINKKALVIKDGSIEWLENPILLLDRLYHYLNMDFEVGKPARYMIWDHDHDILDAAVGFYKSLEEKLGTADFTAIQKALGSDAAPAGFSGDEWAAVRSAHAGYMAGTELLAVLAHIASSTGFFELAVQPDLSIEIPERLTEESLQKRMAKVLVPPPVAKSDEILAASGGMFYPREAPGMDVFVNEGDHFEAGDTLYIVEVMKMFNKVVAPFAGTIEKVLIEGDGAARWGLKSV